MRNSSWGLVAGLGSLVVTLAPYTATAEEVDPSRQVAAAHPGWLHGGPSLRETGRIAPVVLPQAPPNLAQALPADTESPVRVHASRAETSKAVAGQVNLHVLEMEAQPHLKALRGCPLETARRKQVPLSQVSVTDIELSFTIQPNGSVTSAQALAGQAADDDVLACIGRHMFGWRFTPPEGGPAKVKFNVKLEGTRIVTQR